MAFGSSSNNSGVPNPSMILGKDNAAWVKVFTVGQRAAVKTGNQEVSTDIPGQRVGDKDTSQPAEG